jgi:hypothetical protein
MNNLFCHFIITRFNLRREIPISEAWLDKRIELFERYCLPSINAQTDTEFFWFVLFDRNSDKKLKEKINTWIDACLSFVPVMCEESTTVSLCVEQLINYYMAKTQSEYILTTRFDNDDAWHENAIGILQRAVADFLEKNKVNKKDKVFEVFDFPLGVRFHEEIGQLYLWHRPCSPFISLLQKQEEREPGQTVYSFPGGHTKAYETATIHVLNSKIPSWLQVLHDTNILNKLRGDEERTSQAKIKGFDFLWKTK